MDVRGPHHASIERLESRCLLDGTSTSVAVGDMLFTAVSSGTYDGGSDLYRSNLDGSNRVHLMHWSSGLYGPSSLFGFHGQLFFAAHRVDISFSLPELWKSDGTPGGTVLVRDIYGGSQGSFPHDFMIVNDHLLFLATSTSLQQQVFVTDGTLPGTIQLITPSGGYPSAVINVIVFQDRLYAEMSNPVQTERWQTDGTVAGTRVADPLGIIYPDRMLRVFGTYGDDAVALAASRGITKLTINRQTQRFSSEAYDRIELRGMSGDDTIRIGDGVRAPATLVGDSGADQLRGGAGDDHLYGGRPWENGLDDTLDGAAGDDWLEASRRGLIIGGDGDDTIVGGLADGPQTVYGGAGNDWFYPNVYADNVFDGGPGVDSADLSESYGGLHGGGGHFFLGRPGVTEPSPFRYTSLERLIASDKADLITLADDDSLRIIDARRGNDTLIGGAGSESLIGGEGDDSLVGNGGEDLLIGGDGYNAIDGGAARDTLVGATAGGDSLVADSLDLVTDSLVRIIHDYLYVQGTWQDDLISLGAGSAARRQFRATVNGQTATFTAAQVGRLNGISISGGRGGDRIIVGLDVTLAATILGNAGADTITPGGGDDLIDGGDSTDTLDYSAYTSPLQSPLNTYYTAQISSAPGGLDLHRNLETLLCGSGDDDIGYSGVTLRYVDAGPGNDRVNFDDDSPTALAPTVHGADGDDWIAVYRPYGGANLVAPAYYFGDAGDDVFYVSGSNPRNIARDFKGGPGIDTVDYYPVSTTIGVRVTIDDQPGDGAGGVDLACFDNVRTDIEVVIGTSRADTITGSDRDETIFGGVGPDLLAGGGGNDWLEDHYGSQGSNTLKGGPGRDTLVSATAYDKQPDVYFSDGEDAIIKAGIMQITGTTLDDVIHVGLVPGDPQRLRATVNGQVVELPLVFAPAKAWTHVSVATGVTGVRIDGNGGFDSVTIDPALTLPVTILGDKDDRTIPGGVADDVLAEL
jgi:ELWxxDGT repeat protein